MDYKKVFLFLMMSIFLVSSVSASWLNNSYSARIPIDFSGVIENGSALLHVDYTTGMSNDFSDLIFSVNQSGTETEVRYWFYNNTVDNGNSAEVWVKIGKNITGYMYFNNPTATSKSNIRNAFVFGDDFNTNPNFTTDYYSANEGLYTSSNGILTLTGTTTTNNLLRIKNKFYANYTYETRFKVGTADDGFYSMATSQSLGTFENPDGLRTYSDFVINIGNNGGDVGSSVSSNTYYRARLSISTSPSMSNGSFYNDGTNPYSPLIGTYSDTSSYTNGYVGFLRYGSGKTAYMDWVYVTPTESYNVVGTFGTIENLPQPNVTYNVGITGSVTAYTTTYSVTQQSQAGQVAEDTSQALATTIDWFGVILVIGAMVVLIALTILIVYSIKNSGFQGSA